MSRRFGRNQRRRAREELADAHLAITKLAMLYRNLMEQNAVMLDELEYCEAFIRNDARESAENRSLTPDYGHADELADLIARVKGGAV